MQVDPRLNQIDDSLYRVAARALITHEGKILLVKEFDGGDRWAIPGGGVGHGESVESCLAREVEEELGVPTAQATFQATLVLYDIGKVVNGIPRMNLYFKASFPPEAIKKTSHVAEWAWFSSDEFLQLKDLNPSYDKAKIANAIFN